MNSKKIKHLTLSSKELASFKEEGFALVRRPEIRRFRENLVDELKVVALDILKKSGLERDVLRSLGNKSFGDIVDWAFTHEKDRAYTRAMYEVFPTVLTVNSVLGNPIIRDLARAVGIKTPLAGTVPLIRIDRPEDAIFSTPPHQDYWYSMLSDNSVVMWFPLVPLRNDMGLLQAIPKSHKGGLVTFRPTGAHEPFTAQEMRDDKDYSELFLGDSDILVFSQYLLHRSGRNVSKHVRVSMQLRLNDLDTLDHLTSSFTSVISNYVKNRQDEVLTKSYR